MTVALSNGAVFVVEIPKGIENSGLLTACKSAAYRFDGSNPSSPTNALKVIEMIAFRAFLLRL